MGNRQCRTVITEKRGKLGEPRNHLCFLSGIQCRKGSPIEHSGPGPWVEEVEVRAEGCWAGWSLGAGSRQKWAGRGGAPIIYAEGAQLWPHTKLHKSQAKVHEASELWAERPGQEVSQSARVLKIWLTNTTHTQQRPQEIGALEERPNCPWKGCLPSALTETETNLKGSDSHTIS